MASFDEAWAAVNHRKHGEPVSPELQPLLRVYANVLAAPLDLVFIEGRSYGPTCIPQR